MPISLKYSHPYFDKLYSLEGYQNILAKCLKINDIHPKREVVSIYTIQSKYDNSLMYVGVSLDPKQTWNQHIQCAKSNKNNLPLYVKMKEFDPECDHIANHWEFKIYDQFFFDDHEHMFKKEKYIIKKLGTLKNKFHIPEDPNDLQWHLNEIVYQYDNVDFDAHVYHTPHDAFLYSCECGLLLTRQLLHIHQKTTKHSFTPCRDIKAKPSHSHIPNLHFNPMDPLVYVYDSFIFQCHCGLILNTHLMTLHLTVCDHEFDLLDDIYKHKSDDLIPQACIEYEDNLFQQFENKYIIYTIRYRKDDSLIYVGSTTNSLKKRWHDHISVCFNEKRSGYNMRLYQKIRETNDFENWYIELYEEYLCDNVQQLRGREGEVILEIGTLNKNIPGRDKTEYEQYKKNVKKQCECGSNVSLCSLSTHLKTRKHLRYMESLQLHQTEGNPIAEPTQQNNPIDSADQQSDTLLQKQFIDLEILD